MPYEQFATPVAFNQLTTDERDALDVSAESLTIWNYMGNRLQTKRGEYWLDHVLLYGEETFDDGTAVPGHPTIYFDEDVVLVRGIRVERVLVTNHRNLRAGSD